MSENRVEMSETESSSHPILTCSEASSWEQRLLSEKGADWNAMRQVGKSLADGILLEYRQTRFSAERLGAFALVGKGHNGGDALLALFELASKGILASVTVAITGSLTDLKPNSKRAFDLLEKAMPEGTLRTIVLRNRGEAAWIRRLEAGLSSSRFDLCLDGLLGMSFKAPLRDLAREALKRINSTPFRLRVAVDLPSGMGDVSDEVSFQADTTFATGIFKKPLLDRSKSNSIGCIRYLDVGFFADNSLAKERVLVDSILDSIRRRRSPNSDKRNHGRLLIMAGSRNMPGALLMSVHSALRSGVGLVTVCAPESVVPQLAATVPEAMWIPWPETPEGGLSLEGIYLLKRMNFEPDAVLVGPGMGAEAEVAAMLGETVASFPCPVVIDADALRKEVVAGAKGRLIATPHLGEFERIAGKRNRAKAIDESLVEYAREIQGVVVLKGSNTRISDGRNLFVNATGNALLARGGSGDLLAGMTAALLARCPEKPIEAACQAVYWHGRAADVLAERNGQVAVRTTDLLDMYGPALMM